LPDVPAIPQKVRFFTIGNTFIAGASVEAMPAAQFDALVAPLFKDIQGIDRNAWELADRVHAINSALAQTAERKAKGQIYMRLDFLDQCYLLTIVAPEERAESEASDGKP
jgi:hypothetical protein